MKRTIHVAMALGLVLAPFLAGCATEREREFGSSVRHMIAGQRDNPSSPDGSVGSVDGAKAARAVEAYRTGEKPGAAKPATSAILVPTTSAQ